MLVRTMHLHRSDLRDGPLMLTLHGTTGTIIKTSTNGLIQGGREGGGGRGGREGGREEGGGREGGREGRGGGREGETQYLPLEDFAESTLTDPVGACTLMTSSIVDPTTIILAPEVTRRSRKEESSFAKPAKQSKLLLCAL